MNENIEHDEGWEVAEDPSGVEVEESSSQPKPQTPDWRQNWNATGDPAYLPPELQGVHSNMVAGMNTKFREIAEERKALEAEKAALASERVERPQLDDSDLDSLDDSVQKKIDFEVSRRMEPVNHQLESQEQMLAASNAQSRHAAISANPQHTPEVEDAMVYLASNDPFWANALQTDSGLRELQHKAIELVGNYNNELEQAQRISTAPQRGVMRGGGGNASPADKYANSFDKIAEDVFNEAGVPFK